MREVHSPFTGVGGTPVGSGVGVSSPRGVRTMGGLIGLNTSSILYESSEKGVCTQKETQQEFRSTAVTGSLNHISHKHSKTSKQDTKNY